MTARDPARVETFFAPQ